MDSCKNYEAGFLEYLDTLISESECNFSQFYEPYNDLTDYLLKNKNFLLDEFVQNDNDILTNQKNTKERE